MAGGYINGGFSIGRTMFPVPFGFSGPLDGFDTSAFVLTTAVLYSRQIGNPMFRIRRSADDNHCDVLPDRTEKINGTYFVGLNSKVQNFETSSGATTLGEFVASAGYNNPDSLAAASDAFVRTSYDPSGNGRNATQATAARQPQIVSAGSLVTDGSQPAIKFNGTSTFLDLGSAIVDGTHTLVSVFNPDTSDQTNWLELSSDGGNDGQRVLYFSGGFLYQTGTGTSRISLSVTAPTNKTLSFASSDGTTNRFRVNGGAEVTTAQTSYSAATDGVIGKQIFMSKAFASGHAQAFIIWDDLQLSNRSAIESKLADIYGITLA